MRGSKNLLILLIFFDLKYKKSKIKITEIYGKSNKTILKLAKLLMIE